MSIIELIHCEVYNTCLNKQPHIHIIIDDVQYRIQFVNSIVLATSEKDLIKDTIVGKIINLGSYEYYF